MINRDNYQLVSAYLDYQRQVLQLGDDSAERYRFYLRHVLLWADSAPLAHAHTLCPTLPEYLIAAGTGDGRAPRSAATYRWPGSIRSIRRAVSRTASKSMCT